MLQKIVGTIIKLGEKVQKRLKFLKIIGKTESEIDLTLPKIIVMLIKIRKMISEIGATPRKIGAEIQ
jgi:hypothetical protein